MRRSAWCPETGHRPGDGIFPGSISNGVHDCPAPLSSVPWECRLHRPLLLLAVLSAPLTAQTPVSPTDPRVIRGVVVERSNVYDPDEAGSFIARLQNSLHRTTREWVVRREILLAPGQFFDSTKAAETARNLRRLGVFREVRVIPLQTDTGLVVHVRTADAWSTKVGANVHLGAGEFAGSVSLVEENLLGTANRASLGVRKDTDRTSIISAFRGPRLIRGNIAVGAQYVRYARKSDGRILGAQVSRPYYTLSTPSAWSVAAETRRQRILRYFEGEDVASDTAQRRLGLVEASYGWALRASGRGYTRLAVGVGYRREDFGTEAESDAGTIPRTEYGAFGGAIEWRRARFVVSRSFRGLAREEDVDISTTIRAGFWVTPSALGYEEDGIVPALRFRTGIALPSGFAYYDFAAHRRLGAAADSGAVNTALTVFLQPAYRHAAILYVGAGWLTNPIPGAEYDLGFDLGPRGFPAHAFTGDRGFYGTAEYRITVAEDFLKLVGVGVAAFVDYGGAWYGGAARRTGWDAGVGLRLGTSRSTDLDVNRIDLVHCFGGSASACANPGGVSLVIAKGFPFSTTGIFIR